MTIVPMLDASSSTKDKIIHILATEPGINTKAINHILKKQYSLNITYQAVHKTLKQLVEVGVLEEDKKGYIINPLWIERLKLFLSKIDKKEQRIATESVDYSKILDFGSHETISFVINTRKEFDEFLFKIRLELMKRMHTLPPRERVIFHHVSHLYVSLVYPTLEHQLNEELARIGGKAYFLCQGNTPVDKWAAEIYEKTAVKILLGVESEVSRLVFIYPQMIFEAYYSYRTIEIFRRIYERKWSIEQLNMAEFIKDLYSVDEPIKIVINKDPTMVHTLRKIAADIVKKYSADEVVELDTIEDVVSQKDIKGLTDLRKYLPENYCEQAAKYIMENLGHVMITTGFYINGTGTVETDGLIGAALMARALEKLGSKVTFVTDKHGKPVLEKITDMPIVEFPITTWSKSEQTAKELLKTLKPTLLMSIERCGITEEKEYYNIRRENITKYTAKVDPLFNMFEKTVSIADTGNEIGTGNLIEDIKNEQLSLNPSVTKVRHLVLSTTTNWGSYGVIAYLSILAGKKLIELDERPLLEKLVKAGAVDGITKKHEMTYDTFGLAQNNEIIEQLNSFMKRLNN
jgi:hypothetical protein